MAETKITELDKINESVFGNEWQGCVKVTKDEVVTINVMIMILTWTKCEGRSLKQMADYLGITSVRTLVNLGSGMANNETPSHINDKIAENLGKKLNISPDMFKGKMGFLFKSTSKAEETAQKLGTGKNVSNTVLILYRRLKYLIKHSGVQKGAQSTGEKTLREIQIERGILNGLDKDWNDSWGDLESIKQELKDKCRERTYLPKAVKALDAIENIIIAEIIRDRNGISEDDSVKNSYYKMLKCFRYGSPVVASVNKIGIVTEAMNQWSFDALREIEDVELLKRYRQALQEQVAYVGVILRILEKNK